MTSHPTSYDVMMFRFVFVSILPWLVASDVTSVYDVQIVVLIPSGKARLFSAMRIRPALRLAQREVEESGLLAGANITLSYGDSNCSARDAPILAFRYFIEQKVSVYLGPCCDYSLAPVARYAPVWNIPVISPGGLAHDFAQKTRGNAEYPTLTRMGATFNSLVVMTLKTVEYWKWTKLLVIYESNGHSSVTPGFCYLAGSAIIYFSKSSRLQHDFHKYTPETMDIGQMLREQVGNNFSGTCGL